MDAPRLAIISRDLPRGPENVPLFCKAVIISGGRISVGLWARGCDELAGGVTKQL
jgi:hypothetical protein